MLDDAASQVANAPKIGSEVESKMGALQARSSVTLDDNRSASYNLFAKYQVVEDKDKLEFDLGKLNKQK